MTAFVDRRFNIFEEQQSEELLQKKEKNLVNYFASKAKKWINAKKK